MQRNKICSLADLLQAAFSVFGQNTALGLRAGFSYSNIANWAEDHFEEFDGELWPG